MANHADNDFRAAAKALLDVVAPAIDPANPLAKQQLKLVVDWLDFYRKRLPYAQDRERFELGAQLATANEIASALAGTPAEAKALCAAIDVAVSVQSALGPRPPEVRAVTARLEDEISAVVRRSPEFGADARGAIEHIVVRDAKPLLDAQRAWFLPQSIEFDPDSLPPLDAALRIPPPSSN